MKHKTKVMAVMAAMLLFNFKLKAQVTHLGNNLGIPADYIGWDAAQLFPLTIQHLGTAANQTINFSTGGINRMIILNNLPAPTNGFVGIGPSFLAPTSLLHLNELGKGGIATGNLFRTDGTNTLDNKWQMFTGTTNKLT